MKIIYPGDHYPIMFEEVVRRQRKEVVHASSRPENAIGKAKGHFQLNFDY